jgi:hypothetical protein
MSSALTLILQALAYDDVSATSNPTQIRIERRKSVLNIPVDNPDTISVPLAPGASATVIDGTRTTTLDNTSAFSIALSALDPTRYRVSWTGGTNPTFRTNRSVAVAAVALTLVSNANMSLTVTAGAGNPFSGVQVGDSAFIPGPSTGDAATLFNALNEGFWYVVTAVGASITLARAPGTVFSGFSEVVTPAANTQFQVFSSAGVQVGDTVDISAGFASTTFHAFDILTVTPFFVEFQSTLPLGPQTGITPTAAGMIFYTSAKRLIWVETDQEILVRLNGDTGNFNRVEPWLAGDRNFVGPYVKVGTVWKLVVVNLSSASANVLVAAAE